MRRGSHTARHEGASDRLLEGRVALVTGVNNPEGIGAAIARALAERGAAVFGTYLRDPVERYGLDSDEAARAAEPGEPYYRTLNARDADEVSRRMRTAGHRFATCEADLTDPGVAPALFDRAETQLGPVDILVNNAAYAAGDTFVPEEEIPAERRRAGHYPKRTLTAESLDRHWAVNARAPALLMAEFARRHVRRGAGWGWIVSVSSDGAPVFPEEVSYGATKYALQSLTHSAAAGLGAYGITANTVSLGPIQTGWMGPALLEETGRNTPLGRAGTPEDVAEVVAFLVTEQARWVTGQVIYVGGGHRMV